MTDVVSLLERGPLLLWGMGATNLAVARAVLRRGGEIVAVDDAPTEAMQASLADLGVTLQPAPDGVALDALLERCGAFLPAPGLADSHRALRAAAALGTLVRSEFDLAAGWDDRPLVAVTGTNGKTTVTTILTAALGPSAGAVPAGNNDLPLVSAIDLPEPRWFVVEASSFRLARSAGFGPRVAAWLNFAPDHLDRHESLAAYEQAKAGIWRHRRNGDVAVFNAADPVVARHRPRHGAAVSFGEAGCDVAVRNGFLVAHGEALLEIDELPRRFPHDLANAAAVVACALAAGAPAPDVGAALRAFRGLPHRLELVGRSDGVRWYNDSKATTPDATLAAAAAFDSLVLIAGGRNKGFDLRTLAAAAPSVRAVVAIGESAGEIAAAFAGLRPVRTAPDMATAVEVAGDLARRGDAVVLSPACASFDWYESYGARGDDFSAAVADALGLAGRDASPADRPDGRRSTAAHALDLAGSDG